MDNHLSENDIDEGIAPKVYTQVYGKKVSIEGVKLIPLKNHVGEDGDFSELIRITESGNVEDIEGFKVAQISYTKLYPGTIKGWHLHLKQNDLWHVIASTHLLVCLWDVRKNSKTKGVTMRFALGAGNPQLLFIPKGVAHGAANISSEIAQILYFVDRKFDKSNPDEKRIPWNTLGKDFWKASKD